MHDTHPLRANDTRARPLGEPGPGQSYLLTGRKWFCSAPMGDVLLTTALTEGGPGLFLAPRFLEDGQRTLVDLPLMGNILADLALDIEGSLAISLRVARALDEAAASEAAAELSRIGPPIAKYWCCKRPPGFIAEALERLALLWQASLLARHAPAAVADAFVASRIAEGHRPLFGRLADRGAVTLLLGRALAA